MAIPSGGDLVTWTSPEHDKCGNHRTYALTCEQFDVLLERAKGRCELCGVPREGSAWGCLFIDHDPSVGMWAVRGLLCDACNTRLRRSRALPSTARMEHYLNNAWYIQELRRLNLSPDEPIEPAIGSMVSAMGRNWTRLSATLEGCWACGHRNATFLSSWHEIWRAFGPMSLTINHNASGELPAYVPNLYASQLRVVTSLEERERLLHQNAGGD